MNEVRERTTTDQVLSTEAKQCSASELLCEFSVPLASASSMDESEISAHTARGEARAIIFPP